MFKHFKLTIMAVMAVALLVSAACSGDTETIIQTVIVPGDTVVETVIVPGDTVVETVIVEVPGAHIRDIPRNRTLISALKSGLPPVEMWSPYNLGGTHQQGIQFFYEPLVYADNLDGNEYPWLATSWAYNADATELTYNLRDDVIWSDGVKFSSADVVYTINTLRDLGAEVRLGGVYQTFVKEAIAVDDTTVRIVFNNPSPRFHETVIVASGDSSTFIVPKHVWESKDWAEYTAWNEGAGPVTTGAWRVAFSDIQKRMLDRVRTCDEWWACKSGFQDLPQVERYIILDLGDDQSQGTALIKNEIDQTHDLAVEVIQTILDQNPYATTWTGRETGSYGLVSWWPTSLHLNNKDPQLGNSEVRWAISRFLDRELINDFAYANKGQINDWPFPAFKGLQAAKDNLADLEVKYGLGKYDPADGDARLTAAGYTKNSKGFWADSNGDTIVCDIASFPQFSDLGPVLAETLRQHGIDASYAEPTDAYGQIAGDSYTCGLFGHNGSQTGDLYRTLLMFTTGNAANLYGYSNLEFDALVEELAETADITRVRELEYAAMDIYLEDLPDVSLVEFFNRFATNTYYWENWPNTLTDPYMNGIAPHTGYPYTLMKLVPTNRE
jgi:peptide/nickel transport system substrate-binding protein